MEQDKISLNEPRLLVVMNLFTDKVKGLKLIREMKVWNLLFRTEKNIAINGYHGRILRFSVFD